MRTKKNQKIALMAVFLLCFVSYSLAEKTTLTPFKHRVTTYEPDVPSPFDDPFDTWPMMKIDSPASWQGNILDCPYSNNSQKMLLLIDAIHMAICNNPQMDEVKAAIWKQASEVGIAKAAYWPTFSLSLREVDTNTRYPDASYRNSHKRGKTFSAQFNWRLWDFGKREANLNVAKKGLDYEHARHEMIVQKLVAQVAHSYFNARTAKMAWTTQKEILDLSQLTLETTSRREKMGASSKNDYLKTKIAQAKEKLNEQRAQGEYLKTQLALNLLIGMPQDTRHHFPEFMDSLEPFINRKLGDWLRIARENHPAIRAARAQWQAAEEQIKVAQKSRWPTIDLSAQYHENGYPDQGLQATRTKIQTLSINLNYPLFEGNVRTYQINSAKAQAEHKKASLDQVQQKILNSIAQAHTQLMTSLKNEKAAQALVQVNKRALISLHNLYRLRAVDTLELLNAQASFSSAQQEWLRVSAELRIAYFQLLSDSSLFGRLDLIVSP